MTKFKQGDKVRHIDNELEMRVVQYEIVQKKTGLNIITRKNTYKTIYSGKILCSWVDKNDKRQEEAFLESELVLIN